MSVNQSRVEKNEPPQYRKTGRSGSFNSQRNYSGGGVKGGGGNAPPPSSYSNNPSLSSNRSTKKPSNVQGVQSRVSSGSAGVHYCNVVAAGAVTGSVSGAQNGAYSQQPLRGASDAPVGAKATDTSTQKSSTPGVPKAPAPNHSTVSSSTVAPSTPVTGEGGFSLQFGSLSPGLMQIPARTSSAPPNLDEQKREQARYDSLRGAPMLPTHSVPKHVPAKIAGTVDQSNAVEGHFRSEARRDVQVSAGPPSTQSQKPSVHPISGMPMQMPFPQTHIPIQSGGPRAQLHSQNMLHGSVPMPIPIPLQMGNSSQLQQQVYVQGLQSHLMQSQGVMPQGQRISFSSQMGSQLPPQPGNMGIKMTPQFPQQQPGNFAVPRKTVKITHPDTHEELRLDKKAENYQDAGSSALRSHHNMSRPSSLPSTNNQTTPSSQARFNNQVTVKPAANPRAEKSAESSLPISSPAVEKIISIIPSPHREASSNHTLRNPENSNERSLQQLKSTLMPVASRPVVEVSAADSLITNRFSAASTAHVDHPPSVAHSTSEGARRDMFNRSNCNKDGEMKPGKKNHSLVQSQSISSSTLSEGGTIGTLENTKFLPLPETLGQKCLTSDNQPATIGVVVPGGHNVKTDRAGVQGTLDAANISGFDSVQISINSSLDNEKARQEGVKTQENRDKMIPDESKEDYTSLKVPLISSKTSEFTDGTQSPILEVTKTGTDIGSFKNKQQKLEEPSRDGDGANELSTSTSVPVDALTTKTSSLHLDASNSHGGDKNSSSDTSTGKGDAAGRQDTSTIGSGMVDHKSPIISNPSHTELKYDNEVADSDSTDLLSPSAEFKDKPPIETNISKNINARGKKKRKEALQKADRAGTTSDLYMAYKGPEEKKDNLIPAESSGSTSSTISKQMSAVTSQEAKNLSKGEPDDWEDAADISTPKLETSDTGNNVGVTKEDGQDINSTEKKYSRDFLMKFSERCRNLPERFEITSDIAEVFIVSTGNAPRESFPSPGRNVDRPMGGPRLDRRGSGIGDDDRWSKVPGPHAPGRDLRLDTGFQNYGPNVVGSQHGQVGNYGVLRNPRAQSPVQYAGGILSGPMQAIGPHVGMQRMNSESERWQRATGFQRGLIPSPQTPLQVMHKAERKYEVGKITDEEQAKQRQLKGILNKLTPQNFEKLFEQVKQVNIDNAGTLTGVISQIFDKALMEPTFCEMYANFCYHLAGELPDFNEDNEKITFKRLLLNKCQEEFERGEREQEEANRAEEEGQAKQSDEEREEKRIKARRRMLGNIRLIGELYKKKMLTERIMHECIKKLLGQYQNPDEEDVEALCKLMSTIGEMIDHPKAKEHMDFYFDMMTKLSNNMKLSSRVRFMLKDSIDLRKNKWQQRRKVEGPKKIEEVHRDAANERQAQASRLSRGPSMGPSFRRGQQPTDFAPRGSNILPSPNAQMGGFCGFPQQPRGFGAQDARSDDRHPFDNRTLSVPFPQRAPGDDSITLGPQGGLARGMSIRGQPSISQVPFADMPGSDSRRFTAGPNGYGSISNRPAYASREEHVPRFAPDRFVSPSAQEQMNSFDRNISYRSREVRNPLSRPNTPPTISKEPNSVGNVSSEKAWPEEQLRKMSMEAIKEFYSAKDENEVALCVKDLNAPSFYPSMISIWVLDSFERKDMERNLLAKLLVSLVKSRNAMFSQAELVKGFESVLANLEDAVNDAPKAAEFLGGMFAKVILDNVIPMADIGRLIYEGGEEQGRLLEVGLAAEVLGSILEIIKTEKGNPGLNDICTASNLQPELFRPPKTKKSLRLDKFI